MINRRDARIIIPEGFSDDAIPALNNLAATKPEKKSGANSPLAKARKNRRLTLAQVAARIGISPATLGRYEQDTIQTVDIIKAIGAEYRFCPCCERPWRTRK